MHIYEASLSYRLVQQGEKVALDSPEKVVEYMKGAFDAHILQESFWVIPLDRKNKPSGRMMITLGTISGTVVHAREVFKVALLASASAIIVCHNHPSGDPNPSSADIRVTRELRKASEIMDIDLLDHVIIGDKELDPSGKGFYSFADSGLI